MPVHNSHCLSAWLAGGSQQPSRELARVCMHVCMKQKIAFTDLSIFLNISVNTLPNYSNFVTKCSWWCKLSIDMHIFVLRPAVDEKFVLNHLLRLHTYVYLYVVTEKPGELFCKKI